MPCFAQSLSVRFCDYECTNGLTNTHNEILYDKIAQSVFLPFDKAFQSTTKKEPFYNANLNIKSNCGMTALMMAANYEDYGNCEDYGDIIKYLH